MGCRGGEAGRGVNIPVVFWKGGEAAWLRVAAAGMDTVEGLGKYPLGEQGRQ